MSLLADPPVRCSSDTAWDCTVRSVVVQPERTKTFSPITTTDWALGMSRSRWPYYPHCPLRVVALEDLQQPNTSLLAVAGHGMLNQRASALDVGTQQQGSSDTGSLCWHGQNVLALMPGRQSIDLAPDKRVHLHPGNAALPVYV